MSAADLCVLSNVPSGLDEGQTLQTPCRKSQTAACCDFPGFAPKPFAVLLCDTSRKLVLRSVLTPVSEVDFHFLPTNISTNIRFALKRMFSFALKKDS